MNSVLLAASILLGVYQTEDFHFYDDNLQAHGVGIVNKVFVDIEPGDKAKFIKNVEKTTGLDHIKEFDNGTISGVLLFFKSKEDTLNALNELQERGYDAHPIVKYEEIECSTVNQIIVHANSSVNKDDLLARLDDVAKGEFYIIKEIYPKVYLIGVKKLKYPSNVMRLANLIAKDNFWVRNAMVAWVPLEGYVKAVTSIETAANSHLGELRTLKLTIDVFDPKIEVKKDLLPQLGQSLVVFPNTGELWFDAFPSSITESVNNGKKRIVVSYPFRQLQFGNFVIQPITVSYLKDKKLYTTVSNVCDFGIKSVIAETGIEDIQARDMDIRFTIVKPQKSIVIVDSPDILAESAKIPLTGFLIGISLLFFGSLIHDVVTRPKKRLDPKVALWRNLDEFTELKFNEDWQERYLLITSELNNVLTTCFDVSLYMVDLNTCNNNFKSLVNELGKIHTENGVPDIQLLETSLHKFCLERRYD